jgi:hypothetical protein
VARGQVIDSIAHPGNEIHFQLSRFETGF